jgi:hypothetical protein
MQVFIAVYGFNLIAFAALIFPEVCLILFTH